VVLGVCVCVTARRISLGDEGNALYPVFSSSVGEKNKKMLTEVTNVTKEHDS